MLPKYNILILTDHSTHSQSNSLYILADYISQHESCGLLEIASRSCEVNKTFFDIGKEESIYTIAHTHNFNFENAEALFATDLKKSSINDYDVIFMRLPRPLTDEFLVNLKDTAPNVLFINDPLGIITTGNKSFLLKFKEICPPLRLVESESEIREMVQKMDIVLKPLQSYGGAGILKISEGTVSDGKESRTLEAFLNDYISSGRPPYLAVKFLKNVNEGDKRVIVVNGHIIGASLRIPQKGSWLCNMSQGGTAHDAEADEDELQMVSTISSKLRRHGICMYGMDTLVGDNGHRVLSEINTMSIGGFNQFGPAKNNKVLQKTINYFFEYIDEYINK